MSTPGNGGAFTPFLLIFGPTGVRFTPFFEATQRSIASCWSLRSNVSGFGLPPSFWAREKCMASRTLRHAPPQPKPSEMKHARNSGGMSVMTGPFVNGFESGLMSTATAQAWADVDVPLVVLRQL